MIRNEREVLKNDHRWLQNRTNRFLANLLIHFLVKTKIRPNHLTLFSLVLGVTSAFLIILDVQVLRIIASFCLFSSLVLDSADGQLARLKDQTSNFGYWFDKIVDRIKESLLIFAITYVSYTGLLGNKAWLWFLGTGAIFLINFMYYNLEILKKTFNFKNTEFPQDNLVARNLLSFGYGERMIYISILIFFNQLIFVLWLIGIGCIFHILVNTYVATKKREV